MTEKQLNRCSTPLVNREMQMKTALKFHPLRVRMAKINKTSDSESLLGCGIGGIFIHGREGGKLYNYYANWCGSFSGS